MLIFVDTEFTDFIQMDLISIALVSEDGREFYAERTDYRQDDCSEFVRLAVIPMLGRVSGAGCTRDQLTHRLRDWFEALPEPATLIFDYFSDWELLCDAFLGSNFDNAPANVGDKLLLTTEIVTDPAFQDAFKRALKEEFPVHHALGDARALMAGYKAWLA